MIFISTETVTRIFDLHPSDNQNSIDYRVFNKHCSAVNQMIKVGMKCKDANFDNQGLTAVKSFYSLITRNQELKKTLKDFKIRERLLRCASQYAYFAIRNTKHIIDLCKIIAEVLSETSVWTEFPASSWKFWDFKKKSSSYKNKLDSEIVNLIKTEHQRLYPNRRNFANYSIVQNYYSHLKKHLMIHLSTKFYEYPTQLLKTKEILLRHYTQDYLKELLRLYFVRVSTILTRRFKRLKKQDLLKQKKNLKQKYTSLSKIVHKICGTKKLLNVDFETWQLKKQLWMMEYKDIINKSVTPKKVMELITNCEKQIKQKPIAYFVKHFLYPDNLSINHEITENSVNDFHQFFAQLIYYHLTNLVVDQKAYMFLPEVRNFLLLFIQKPLKYLKIPRFTKASIPLGIDDGQVYSLSEKDREVEVTFSFYPNQRRKFKLSNSQEYFELIKNDASPSRGVLMARGGKLQLALPFLKRLPVLSDIKKVEQQKILNCDLGLKTFAALSVTIKGVEIDRKFLDQKQFVGKKNQWFLPLTERKRNEKQNSEYINYKMKLIKIQKRIYKLQSELDKYRKDNARIRRKKNSVARYNNSREYWYKRREYNQCRQKLHNIHREIVKQIASRIVEYAKHQQVDSIRFEDLRWVKHSPKKKIGYFLSNWQIHWFYGQIIEFSSRLARRNGIRTYLTDPYMSSQHCSSCGTKGKRNKKTFQCSNKVCGLKLDSDLNAARNLGKPLRKSYLIRL